MIQLIFMITAFALVLLILPWLPIQITMKGKLMLAAISGILAAFLLFSVSLFALWQSLLVYAVLALAAAYAAGIYGFPAWSLEETHSEALWIEEEPEQASPKEEVFPASNMVVEEPPQLEPDFDQPEKDEPLLMPEAEFIEPASVLEKYVEPFDEDDYILSLYSDRNQMNDTSLDDQVSGDGQSDYLAELLSEMEETEAEPDHDMEEIPLLHLKDESEQKKSADTH